jgi:hypothetical protein
MLRLAARYADVCNLYPNPDLPHKLSGLGIQWSRNEGERG